MEIGEQDLRYLQLLAKRYPGIQAASTEIINLSAILQLPKGTEHFLSDVHGEHEAFLHVLKNDRAPFGARSRRSSAVRFWSARSAIWRLSFTIREQKLSLTLNELDEKDEAEWYRVTLFRLVRVCASVSSEVYSLQGAKGAAP